MSVIVPEIITIKPTANAGAGADASDAKRHYQEESVWMTKVFFWQKFRPKPVVEAQTSATNNYEYYT